MDPRILELCREDSRFAYEAYDFVCDAVTFTQDRMGRAADRDEIRSARCNERNRLQGQTTADDGRQFLSASVGEKFFQHGGWPMIEQTAAVLRRRIDQYRAATDDHGSFENLIDPGSRHARTVCIDDG